MFGILSYICYILLIQAKVAVKVSTFGAIGGKLYGPYMQRLILTSIMLSQIEFVATCIVFTSENFKAFFQNTFHIDVIKGLQFSQNVGSTFPCHLSGK